MSKLSFNSGLKHLKSKVIYNYNFYRHKCLSGKCMTVELECISCMYFDIIEFSASFITSVVTSSAIAK